MAHASDEVCVLTAGRNGQNTSSWEDIEPICNLGLKYRGPTTRVWGCGAVEVLHDGQWFPDSSQEEAWVNYNNRIKRRNTSRDRKKNI